MRRFVDRAHAAGIGVILDVVYNHLGPDGNYLKVFCERYFTDRYKTDWGEAINFDGEGAEAVTELFVANAGYWIDEYHLDGLRLDATDNVHDEKGDHVLAAIVRRARAAAGERSIIVVAENEQQRTQLVRPPESGGFGIDALWNDDFHHSAVVALSGPRGAYYTDYAGTPQELISAIKRGYLYQGQWYAWQKQRRGTSTSGLQPRQFVTFIENHDQVANTAAGLRMHQVTSPGRWRAMTALILLAPGTPMLFQGQEFCSSKPFLYFADHGGELGQAVRRGRAKFLSQFPDLALPEAQAKLTDPSDPMTFERSKLDLVERKEHQKALALHRDLLKLRREDPTFRAQAGAVDGAVLAERAFVLRFASDRVDGRGDRLLLVNLGDEVALRIAPEPLLAPPRDTSWRTLWSSEHETYGGLGVTEPETDGGWYLAAECAIVLKPREGKEPAPAPKPQEKRKKDA
jgi:maltooligosyltrehalose trehalohydrolase